MQHWLKLRVWTWKCRTKFLLVLCSTNADQILCCTLGKGHLLFAQFLYLTNGKILSLLETKLLHRIIHYANENTYIFHYLCCLHARVMCFLTIINSALSIPCDTNCWPFKITDTPHWAKYVTNCCHCNLGTSCCGFGMAKNWEWLTESWVEDPGFGAFLWNSQTNALMVVLAEGFLSVVTAWVWPH